jgi:hypothetical protein
MTEPASVRGAARDRRGALDITMLIWKMVDANPGITRRELFAKIEHDIPPGWAERRYKSRKRKQPGTIAETRWYVLTDTIVSMIRTGSLRRDPPPSSSARDKAGTARMYVARELQNWAGDASKIDATQTRAATHMKVAYAIQTVRGFLARGSTRMTKAELEALRVVMSAEIRPPIR